MGKGHITEQSNAFLHPGWATASLPTSLSSSCSTPLLPACCEQDPGLTFSVQRSTHLSTDMFGMAAVMGRARERLSGLRKQPRKTALPSGEPEGEEVVRSRQAELPSEGSTFKLKPREGKSFAQGYTVNQSGDE